MNKSAGNRRGDSRAKQHICKGTEEGKSLAYLRDWRKASVDVQPWGRERAPPGEGSVSAISATMPHNKQSQSSVVYGSGVGVSSKLCSMCPSSPNSLSQTCCHGNGTGMHWGMPCHAPWGAGSELPYHHFSSQSNVVHMAELRVEGEGTIKLHGKGLNTR